MTLISPSLDTGLKAFSSGVRLALIIVFFLSVIEKAITLTSRSGPFHPILSSRRFWREHAALILASSILADALVIGALLVAPSLGGFLSLGAILAYSVAGWSGYAGSLQSQCGCLWRMMQVGDRTGFIIRNTILLLVSGSTMALAWVADGHVQISPASIGSAAAVLVTIDLILRASSRVRLRTGWTREARRGSISDNGRSRMALAPDTEGR